MSCECIKKLDEELKPKNLCVSVMFSLGPGPSMVYPAMHCELIEKKRGKRAPVLAPTYCPFCGVRYRPEGSEAPAGIAA